LKEHCLAQVYNFVEEFGSQFDHMGVPKILQVGSLGKVVIDTGLNGSNEFFAALEFGYLVHGFEPHPGAIAALQLHYDEYDRVKQDSIRCMYLKASDVREPLPPLPSQGHLMGVRDQGEVN
jgi:hypothetical protein